MRKKHFLFFLLLGAPLISAEETKRAVQKESKKVQIQGNHVISSEQKNQNEQETTDNPKKKEQKREQPEDKQPAEAHQKIHVFYNPDLDIGITPEEIHLERLYCEQHIGETAFINALLKKYSRKHNIEVTPQDQIEMAKWKADRKSKGKKYFTPLELQDMREKMFKRLGGAGIAFGIPIGAGGTIIGKKLYNKTKQLTQEQCVKGGTNFVFGAAKGQIINGVIHHVGAEDKILYERNEIPVVTKNMFIRAGINTVCNFINKELKLQPKTEQEINRILASLLEDWFQKSVSKKSQPKKPLKTRIRSKSVDLRDAQNMTHKQVQQQIKEWTQQENMQIQRTRSKSVDLSDAQNITRIQVQQLIEWAQEEKTPIKRTRSKSLDLSNAQNMTPVQVQQQIKKWVVSLRKHQALPETLTEEQIDGKLNVLQLAKKTGASFLYYTGYEIATEGLYNLIAQLALFMGRKTNTEQYVLTLFPKDGQPNTPHQQLTKDVLKPLLASLVVQPSINAATGYAGNKLSFSFTVKI